MGRAGVLTSPVEDLRGNQEETLWGGDGQAASKEAVKQKAGSACRRTTDSGDFPFLLGDSLGQSELELRATVSLGKCRGSSVGTTPKLPGSTCLGQQRALPKGVSQARRAPAHP